MVSRERLLHLAERGTELATARRVRLAAQLLLVAAFAFVLVRLRSAWHDSHVDLGGVDWLALVGAFVVSVVGVGAGAFIWLAILKRLGVKTRPRWVGVFFQAQLGKYIPGTIWQYAGRATLARAHGIPIRAVGLSLPVELAAVALGAAVMSPLLVGWWGLLAVAAAAVAVAVSERRVATRMPTAVRAGARASLYYLYAWVPIALGFWLTARALVGVPARDIALYAGVCCVAWLAGFVAVYAPGGLGVREAVLVGLLAGRLGTADALVVAAVSRVLLTLVDLALGGAGVVLLRGSRRRPSLQTATPAATSEPPARSVL
jgi:uncharacterized membrane protein YbhN (UPF0104 family)